MVAQIQDKTVSTPPTCKLRPTVRTSSPRGSPTNISNDKVPKSGLSKPELGGSLNWRTPGLITRRPSLSCCGAVVGSARAALHARIAATAAMVAEQLAACRHTRHGACSSKHFGVSRSHIGGEVPPYTDRVSYNGVRREARPMRNSATARRGRRRRHLSSCRTTDANGSGGQSLAMCAPCLSLSNGPLPMGTHIGQAHTVCDTRGMVKKAKVPTHLRPQLLATLTSCHASRPQSAARNSPTM